MTPPVLALFNNKGGVGKTSLVYHLAWMFSDLGLRVLAVDLDPQANLTSAFLSEERLEQLWDSEAAPAKTVFGAIQPLLEGTGDLLPPPLEVISDSLALLPGDLALSAFEDELSQQWPKAGDGDIRSFRVLSAFWRLMRSASDDWNANLVVMDVGPNLGAINRAALLSVDHILLPLSPDLFSLQGLRNLGPAIRNWRAQWATRIQKNPKPQTVQLPAGRMEPLGYLVISHSVRLDRPVKAYNRWLSRIPDTYRSAVLGIEKDPGLSAAQDPHCLAMLKHYRSLMPLSQEARKPIFHLQPADGALGAHEAAVRNAYRDFEGLARAIASRINLSIPG